MTTRLCDSLQHRQLPDVLPSAWYYSSPAYGLLARIVERASNVPYRDFLDQNVFEPLAMRDTFAGNGNERPDVAVGYTDGKAVPSMELDTLSMGAGDIWSTVRDIDRWNAALISDELLSPESRMRMFTPHADVEGFPIPAGYGYGWLITDLGGRRLYAHTGDNIGYTALNIVLPDECLRVVILSNDYPAELLPLAMSFLGPADG